MGNEVLVSLDGMQEPLEIDHERGLARVQAGIRLYRLIDVLAEHDLGPTIIGSVTEQSLAGVMSTGTHGSSLVHGNISSFVVGLRMVTGTGEVVELGEHDPRLAAARVGLGALGIITEVTIRVEPSFRLRETTEVMSVDEAVASMAEISRSAEYVKVWWLPHTDAVMVFRYERTQQPGRLSRVSQWIDAWLINRVIFVLLLWLGRHVPRLTQVFNGLVARTYLARADRVDRADRLLSLAMPPRHRETEFAVPVERSGEALAAMRDRIATLDWGVNFIQELRFVKADDAWMSPANERDSCQIGAYMAQAPGIDDYFEGFEADMLALDGRPHWGKEFAVRGAALRACFPRAEEFVELADRFDPDGLFRNDFLERILER